MMFVCLFVCLFLQLTSSSGDEESSLTVVNPVPPPTSNQTLPALFNSHTRSKPKPGKSAASAKSASPTQQGKNHKNLKKSLKPKKEVQEKLSIFDASDGSDSDAAGDAPLFSVPQSGVPTVDIFSTGGKATSSSSSDESPATPRKGLEFDLGDSMLVGENHTSHLPFNDAAELKKVSEFMQCH